MSDNLYHVEKGKEYIVVDTPDLKLLSSMGVFEGVKIRKENIYKFGGPVSVSLATRKIAIGKEVAEKILVKEAV
ncbi:MAG: FeoA family protein [Caldicoprobacterales bacterium]|nr:ferrous iron transport protein A [Clostridiales bacterium]